MTFDQKETLTKYCHFEFLPGYANYLFGFITKFRQLDLLMVIQRWWIFLSWRGKHYRFYGSYRFFVFFLSFTLHHINCVYRTLFSSHPNCMQVILFAVAFIAIGGSGHQVRAKVLTTSQGHHSKSKVCTEKNMFFSMALHPIDPMILIPLRVFCVRRCGDYWWKIKWFFKSPHKKPELFHS